MRGGGTDDWYQDLSSYFSERGCQKKSKKRYNSKNLHAYAKSNSKFFFAQYFFFIKLIFWYPNQQKREDHMKYRHVLIKIFASFATSHQENCHIFRIKKGSPRNFSILKIDPHSLLKDPTLEMYDLFAFHLE